VTGSEQVTINELARQVREYHEEVTGLRTEVGPAIAFYTRTVETIDDAKQLGRGLGRALKYGTAVGASLVTIFAGLRVMGVV
jgi:hypothetical protein